MKPNEKLAKSLFAQNDPKADFYFPNASQMAWMIHQALVHGCLESLESAEAFIDRFELTPAQQDIIRSTNLPEGGLQKIADQLSKEEWKTFYEQYPLGYTYYSKKDAEAVDELAARLLDIHEGDIVLDLNAGRGDFLKAAALYEPAGLLGIEQDADTARLSALDNHQAVVKTSLLDLEEQKPTLLFGRLYDDWPDPFLDEELYKQWGVKLDPDNKNDFRYSPMKNWIVLDYYLHQLPENGRAVILMSTEELNSSSFKKVKSQYVENGWIKSIIQLPRGLFKHTRIPVSLVVFDKSEQEAIRMIDASHLGMKKEGLTALKEKDLKTILEAMEKDTSYSTLADIETVRKKEYILGPDRYCEQYVTDENAVPFGDLILGIERGNHLKASELERYRSWRKTNELYLPISALQDGLVDLDEECSYLKDLPENLKNKLIHHERLLVTKIDSPFKTAVLDPEDDMGVLISGNIYAIRLDLQKADPYYIQAFFDSTAGRKAISAQASGKALKMISVSSLKQIMIPLPSLEKQRKYGEEYKRCLRNASWAKSNYQKYLENMQAVLDHDVEEEF